MMHRGSEKTVRLAVTSLFTALTCIVTMVFTIYVPATKGFFNIGETVVYLSALLFGPAVGAFSGGVGSMAADLLLGYYYYAPATLVIKALEGLIVGILSRKQPRFHKKQTWKEFTAVLGVLIGVLLGLLGFLYYSGSLEVYLGIPPPETPVSSVFIPMELWFGLGGVVAVLIVVVGFFVKPDLGWTVLSIVFGGLFMVTGYFVYQQLIGGFFFPNEFIGVFAFSEIPINIGQMVIGLVVSVMTLGPIQRALRLVKK